MPGSSPAEQHHGRIAVGCIIGRNSSANGGTPDYGDGEFKGENRMAHTVYNIIHEYIIKVQTHSMPPTKP